MAHRIICKSFKMGGPSRTKNTRKQEQTRERTGTLNWKSTSCSKFKELIMSSRRYPTISSGALFCVSAAALVACSTGRGGAAAFVPPTSIRGRGINIIKANTNGIATTTTLGAWFGGGNSNAKQQDGEKDTKASSTTPPPPSRLLDGFGRPVVDDGTTDGTIGGDEGGQMGRTASTLESFKASQEVGKRTAQVLSELTGMTVEGVGPLGILAYVDGRGRPTGIKVDASLLSGGGREDGAAAAAAAATGVSAEDVQDAITKAFQDAYDKSLEQQEEKMMPLYSDLGLAS